jgi:hypothetical protein
MQHLIQLASLALALLAAVPARADVTTVDLDAYAVSEANRFQQVALTPEIIRQTLTALPEVGQSQLALGDQMMAIQESEQSSLQKTVARLAAMRDDQERIRTITRTHGFGEPAAFFHSFRTLLITLDRDNLRQQALRDLRVARRLRQEGPAQRLMTGSLMRDLEFSISAAQQQPTANNATVAEPFRAEVMRMIRRW